LRPLELPVQISRYGTNMCFFNIAVDDKSTIIQDAIHVNPLSDTSAHLFFP